MVTLLQSKDPRAKVLQGLTRWPPSLHRSSSSFRNMGGDGYPPLGLDESKTRRSWVDESDPDTTGGHSGTSSIAIGHALAAANPHENARRRWSRPFGDGTAWFGVLLHPRTS